MAVPRHKVLPNSFEELERLYGWNTAHIHSLVGRELPKEGMSNRVARYRLMELADEYGDYFGRKETVHVFPLKGAAFQHAFAAGVCDGLGIKRKLVRVTTSAWDKSISSLSKSALQKLNAKEFGVMVHDFVEHGGTFRQIAAAAGRHEDRVGLHKLTLDQVSNIPKKIVPGPDGEDMNVAQVSLAYKLVGKDPKLTRPDPEDATLTPEQTLFLMRTLHSAGYVAAKEAEAERVRMAEACKRVDEEWKKRNEREAKERKIGS